MSAPLWRQLPEVGSALGIRFVAGLTRLCGRRVAASFLWLLALYYALFAVTARRASRAYLQRIGAPPTFRSVVTHFWHFAQVTLDRLLFLSGHTGLFDVELHGDELIQQAVATEPHGKRMGSLLLGSHIGSFEAMRAMALAKNVPLNVVVDFRNAERVNSVLERVSPGLGIRLIQLDPASVNSIFDVKACIERGELVAILSDRVAGRRTHVAQAAFLGSPAPLPTGPFILAHVLGCPVLLVFALFRAPNRYDVFCETFSERIHLPRGNKAQALGELAAQYARALERYAKMAPYNWFNFYDFWSQ